MDQSYSSYEHGSSYESSIDPCTEGLVECQARNYTSCIADESTLSYMCKDCDWELIDTGDSCVGKCT